MSIEFTCTQCGRPLQAGDASPGTRVLCPGCGAFSSVPQPQPDQPQPDQPQPVQSQPTQPIEFRCSACSKLLRVPADTAGKQAKCPECGQVVPVPSPTAPGLDETLPHSGVPQKPAAQPASPFAPGGEPHPAVDSENPYLTPTQYGQPPQTPFGGPDAMAASRVSGPATALIVTGALGIAVQVLGVISNLAQIGGMGARGQGDMAFFLSGGVGAVAGIVSLVLGIVIILGAVKMKNLKSYGFAMTAAIIAMVRRRTQRTGIYSQLLGRRRGEPAAAHLGRTFLVCVKPAHD